MSTAKPCAHDALSKDDDTVRGDEGIYIEIICLQRQIVVVLLRGEW